MPDGFAYLVDLSNPRLQAELAYAKGLGLTELEEACELEIRSRGKQWDFMWVYFGNAGSLPEEPEDGEA